MTTDSAQSTPVSARTVALAMAVDALCILVFVAVGRRNHAEGVTLAGVAQTAWPFLAGGAVGWATSKGWRAPTALRPTGLWVWLDTIVVGMALRAGIGAGIALSFIAVASTVTGVLLLGWRALYALLGRRSG